MEIVQFARDGGAVLLQVEISGPIGWRYKYVAEDYTYVRTSTDQPPFKHALGLPHEINGELHSWDIQVANIGDSETAYAVTLSWVQDGATKEDWSARGNLEPNKSRVHREDAFVHGS